MIAQQTPPPTDAEREKPARRPLPAHLPRERVVHAAPCACRHCGSGRIRKLGEQTAETLERVPAHWKVITHVRETFTCRVCEKITETPSPSHPIVRGRAGPHLLAEVVFAKYRAHLPLNRQSDIYAKEGVDLDVSTLAGWVGAAAATLIPLTDEIEKHVLAAERIHADDTTVPVLAKGKCTTGRLWAYVRDDRPFSGDAAPAALFYYSLDRAGKHPEKHLARYPGISRPTPTPVTTDFTRRGVNRARSSKRPVGPTVGASSSNWPTCRKRRSLSKPCGAWTNSSPSSATSTGNPPIIAMRCANSDPNRWSRRLKNGCEPSDENSHRKARSPRRSTTA